MTEQQTDPPIVLYGKQRIKYELMRIALRYYPRELDKAAHEVQRLAFKEPSPEAKKLCKEMLRYFALYQEKNRAKR